MTNKISNGSLDEAMQDLEEALMIMFVSSSLTFCVKNTLLEWRQTMEKCHQQICKDKDTKPRVWESAIPLKGEMVLVLYNRLVQTNIPQLLPLMVAAISVLGPDKVSPHLKTHFTELKGAQVKTVSFLTYLLKSFVDYIRPNEESICKSIVNLLVTCSDFVSIRKVNECESISHRICELISLDEMESSWKKRVKKIHLKESYEEIP
uniref:Uncharacterized protein n=1 Tax=Lactuca sativa TaxID=4236 RepID=A0A9R1X9D2_LACSA|nr:hypothetical protein LSAT_V11C500277880 [Lactuca sativa]